MPTQTFVPINIFGSDAYTTEDDNFDFSNVEGDGPATEFDDTVDVADLTTADQREAERGHDSFFDVFLDPHLEDPVSIFDYDFIA